MNIIKSIAGGLCFGIAAAVMTVSPARAILLEQDLFAAGDKLITLDTDTGLQWLDVPETLGLSYNQAQATAFVTTHGFRHATLPEVDTLYRNAGVIFFDAVAVLSDAGQIAAVAELIAKLGQTAVLVNPQANDRFRQRGFSDFVPFEPLFNGIPRIDLDEFSIAAGAFTFGSFGSKDLVLEDAGNYLVRSTAIPEPGTLGILGLGLAGLGLARRRKAV